LRKRVADPATPRAYSHLGGGRPPDYIR